jgi:hypothetical protein
VNTAVRAATEADAEAMATIYVDSWNDGFGHLIGAKSAISRDDAARWQVRFRRSFGRHP